MTSMCRYGSNSLFLNQLKESFVKMPTLAMPERQCFLRLENCL